MNYQEFYSEILKREQETEKCCTDFIKCERELSEYKTKVQGLKTAIEGLEKNTILENRKTYYRALADVEVAKKTCDSLETEKQEIEIRIQNLKDMLEKETAVRIEKSSIFYNTVKGFNSKYNFMGWSKLQQDLGNTCNSLETELKTVEQKIEAALEERQKVMDEENAKRVAELNAKLKDKEDELQDSAMDLEETQACFERLNEEFSKDPEVMSLRKELEVIDVDGYQQHINEKKRRLHEEAS